MMPLAVLLLLALTTPAGADLHRAAAPQDPAVGGVLSMTTQDIYSWVQIGLQVLVGGALVAGLYRYFGVLKRLIEGQEKTIAAQAEQMKALKATIDAQAEQMKAQSTVLQDVERLYNVVKHVLDTVSDPAALQREQAYKARG
jgi:hypothetical protein